MGLTESSVIAAVVITIGLVAFVFVSSSVQPMDSLVRALPFWASVTAMSSVYTLFLAPIWDQSLYYSTFDMTVLQYRTVISAATAGSMITFLPGFLSQRIGARAVLLCTIPATLILYGGLAFECAIGGIVHASPTWKIVLFAFLIGQSAAWVKMATFLNTIDNVHPSTVGKCLGFIIASFEVCNCFYTQVTETWTSDLMLVSTNYFDGTTLVALRRLPIVFFLFMCVPGFYSLPRSSVLPDARDLSMSKLMWVSLLAWLMAIWNWTLQKGWCYFNTFETMDIWNLFSTCICAYAVSLLWGVQIVTNGILGAMVVRARGWIPSVAPVVMYMTKEPDQAKLSDGGAEDKHLDVPKHLFLCLALTASVVIGSGQAVGNNYFWIATSLHSETFMGFNWNIDMMNYAGMYMFSKIFASVHVMIPWDNAPSRSTERTSALAQIALVAAFSQLLLSLGHTITTDNTVLVFGLIGTGYATGAMNSLIVATSLDFYGRRKFVRVWSELMALAAVAMVIFFNGLDGLDMKLNHTSSSDKYFDIFSKSSDSSTTDRCYWGGCESRPSCIQWSMLVQAVACFAAALAVSLIQPRQENRENDDDAGFPVDDERSSLINRVHP